VSLDNVLARAIESHTNAVARGEHDDRCEWRPGGFYICNCSKRRRTKAGYTTPPGELIEQMPVCPRCLNEVDHDSDCYVCYPCCVYWPDGTRSDAAFFDDHGDLTDDLAKWEAAHANRGDIRHSIGGSL
jgi:hypothetical protein